MDISNLKKEMTNAMERFDIAKIEDIAKQMKAYVEEKSNTLIEAARNGDIEGVKEALKQGADVNARNNLGFTVMMCAAQNLTLELVELLVSHGANVNEPDYDGITAMMWAAKTGILTPKLIEALVSHGADMTPGTIAE